ncbi:putative RNA methylase [Yasminevirus sp. GU-2018]|uniref:Putative RNA methylase n=1 Tax=Yasminevirus sp. GU-2018 TaxID=2420051 RepID=A0A5K0U9A9_9VIRU|nr:putative RNA methylase [Yasminevirus sp. GU-2018]
MNIIHNHKRVMYNKLFPLPPSKSYNNLMIDDEAVSFITTPANSETITAIIDSHIPDYVMRSDITILDGTACVGGDSIAFGKNFGSVIASEIDEKRHYMLTNNLKEYELYNVVPVNTDCLKILKRVNFINIMYFDPPWGGKQYKEGTNLRLSIGDFYVDELIDIVFDETKQPRSDVQMVVLKLPKNYDLYTLYNNTKHRDITLYLYDLPKMYVVVAKKNNAWKNF